MSKISRKIIFTVIVMLLTLTVIIISVSLVMSKKQTDELMTEHTVIGIHILENDMTVEEERLGRAADSIVQGAAAAALSGNTRNLETSWNKIKSTDNDFAILTDTDGNVLWQSEGCKITSYDVSAALAGDVKSGISANCGVQLALEYITPVKYNNSTLVGAVIVGMDLAEPSYLDNVKTQSETEVTLFAGPTRYSTTIVDKNGDRVIGTDMADNVKSTVIDGGEEYKGKAVIVGQEYYVIYQPMYDMDGKLVGAYFSGLSAASSNALFRNMLIIVIVMGVAVMVISSVLLFLLIRKMIEKPINEVNKIADDMCSGNLGTPDSSFTFSDDEMGMFAKRLEVTKKALNTYINDISDILAHMGDGDFTHTPAVEYIGDFIRINDSFKKINKNLHGIIQNIILSANEVMSGAEQMESGSQTLADGTTTQAAAIEQLSSSISDISSQITNTANNAGTANELSLRTSEKISVQDNEIKNMISAMNDIQQHSQEISKIIGTIEDIAFQTNILALNAAVEAARAGDAGKGFAVVADEVRNLAAKSSEAAQSTNALITATVNAVENGSRIAEATAESMKSVKTFAEQTNDLITQISQASATQSEAVHQVTAGIDQISGVVQMNSATAEQSAASCETLSSMSRELKNQISKLKA
ncbi:MAG: methyl-accepting chemotaxis protein [Oscillospiraceae bacterium]|nr:methyl-accepting chemotaxis protein [Oscillospiraceae bacterium]MDY2864418.1 methyl-accepting chemotaxis protein [Oscillospiraceae bacterium]